MTPRRPRPCVAPALGWDGLHSLEAVETDHGLGAGPGAAPLSRFPSWCVCPSRRATLPVCTPGLSLCYLNATFLCSEPSSRGDVYGLSLRGPGSIPRGRVVAFAVLKHVAGTAGSQRPPLGPVWLGEATSLAQGLSRLDVGPGELCYLEK